ncbi:reverse transcriptase domain-containing protein [Tanacetum coccineum]
MLSAFPMSLAGAASRWLRNKPSGSITTWEDLKIKFLSKYCPHARTAKKMEEINNFQQELDKNLYQAWERFKELLMKCPQHYLTEMQEVVLFYNGLDVPTRQILDSRGAMPSKSTADANCMTRSSMRISIIKEALQGIKSDELRSPGFNLFSDQEDYSEEEVAETMAETMKQYMSKTRTDYG